MQHYEEKLAEQKHRAKQIKSVNRITFLWRLKVIRHGQF